VQTLKWSEHADKSHPDISVNEFSTNLQPIQILDKKQIIIKNNDFFIT
jgi:hypothetical protein